MVVFDYRRGAGADPAGRLPDGAQVLEQAQRALEQGRQRVGDKLSPTETARRTIKAADLDIRRTPGTQRINDRSSEVIYTPPEGEACLRDLLANWERFLHNQTELDPLVRMAVGHYQFEAIHPFADGNGRTGRVLNILFLIQAELLTLPILYLSRHLIAHKTDYYRLLLDTTRSGHLEPWIIFMLQAVEETAKWTTAKIAAIRTLAEHTTAHVREHLPKIYTRELVDVIFEPPYCRIGNLVEKTLPSASRPHAT
jgi:Fic family protein